MKLLVLDTCGAVGGVALAAPAVELPLGNAGMPRVIAERTLSRGEFASGVVTAVREVLQECGVMLREVDAIVVMHGPGSFTGIRVGLSAAKGLAHASGVRLIALSRLAMMAAVASEAHEPGPIHVAMDAGRGEFYFGSYRDAGAVCVEEALLNIDAMQQRVQAESVFVCEDAAREKLTGAVMVVMMRAPVAADCIPLAARAYAAGEFASLAELDANYLRAPVAAPPRNTVRQPE